MSVTAPISQYLWTLKFEFHIIFIYHEILLFDFFFFCQSLKIWKPFSPCRPYRNRIWPMGCSVLIPVLYHDLVVFPSYWYLKLSYLLFCFFCCLSLRAGRKLLEGTSFVLVTILSLSSSTVPQLWRCFMNIWWLNVFRKYFAAVVSLPVQTVTL